MPIGQTVWSPKELLNGRLDLSSCCSTVMWKHSCFEATLIMRVFTFLCWVVHVPFFRADTWRWFDVLPFLCVGLWLTLLLVFQEWGGNNPMAHPNGCC